MKNTKIYWFTNTDSPDRDFFKYGNRKPSDEWCMFATKLGAYKHAYKIMVNDNDLEDCWKDDYPDDCLCINCTSKLPENPSLEDYEKVFKVNQYDIDENVIEIPLWDDREEQENVK